MNYKQLILLLNGLYDIISIYNPIFHKKLFITYTKNDINILRIYLLCNSIIRIYSGIYLLYYYAIISYIIEIFIFLAIHNINYYNYISCSIFCFVMILFII